MKTTKYLIFFIVLFSASRLSAAEINVKYDAGYIYESCNKITGSTRFENIGSDSAFYVGLCYGTVTGVAYIIGYSCVAGYQSPGVKRADITNASPQAMVQAFVNYAQSHPQDWSRLGAWLIADALEQYFPCNR